ncbi:esterase E4-like [Planococcus citri]|uniref:esterase E4-like n=1 Tax=Planococcus citri TaxID=170843 RepID=UPI0031F7F50E
MADKATVTVNEGKVKGIKKVSNFSGVEYYSFLGIPYGQPPIGNLRFKDPVKAKPWKNILEATTERDGCRQFSLFKRRMAGSEDCLYNNIHTPSLPSNDEPLKPVIVTLHPGGFVFGNPDPSFFGSPDYVMHNDVVFVGVSFRLHILGFLNLGLKDCSGNQGLKDIILSLEWIKENIHVFGGDPNNVTVLGSSSGSALTHILMLSPRAKGLFHKTVLMGTSVFNPTLITQCENAGTALEVARAVGYEGTADKSERRKLLSFYKNMPIDAAIVFNAKAFMNNAKNVVSLFPISPFHPTLDLESENSILPYSFETLMKSSTGVPFIIGFCDKEAAMAFTKPLKERAAKNFYTIIRQNHWGWGRDLSDDQIKEIQTKIENYYLDGKPVDNFPVSTKCNILSDIALSDVYDTLINPTSLNPSLSAYVYRFEFEGSIITMKEGVLEIMDQPIDGTVHGCDYSYWCMMKDHHGKHEYVLTQKTREILEKFTKLICTFARTGDPNYHGLEVQWNPSTVENPCYLSIKEELKIVDGKLNGERMEFWETQKKLYRAD